ncbi:MAG: YhgE/Pip domain-containing protein [Clostridia bacterium]|nr:YhgE/Pip domain-containing protein [Clostridia bacterium]
MKGILKVFTNDVKNISKRSIAVIIMIGLLIIPGIYAWLNIDSNWNPYDNTGNLPIAIVNKDTGVVLFDKEINMGKSLVENLEKNKAMKWIFTDEETAKKNVDESVYYGEIVIPEDFSSRLSTIFGSEEIKKPQFDFYVNQKKNPIAPIIVNKAVATVQSTLNQTFANTIIYTIVNTAEDLDIVTKRIKTTDELIGKLSEAKENISQIRAIFKTLALASDSTNKSLKAVKDLLPTVSSITGMSKTEISNIKSTIKSVGQTRDNVNNNLSKILETIESLVKESRELVNNDDKEIISENLEKLLSKMEDIKTKLVAFQENIEEINQTINLTQIEKLREKITEMINKVEDVQKLIESGKDKLENIDNIKTKMQELQNNVEELEKIYSESVKADLDKSYSDATKSMTDITGVVSNLDSSLGKTNSALGSMMSALNNTKELTDNVDIVLLGLQADIDRIINTLNEGKTGDIYEKIASLLENTPKQVADFLTSPVETNEIDVYEINSYGSKMAPFYTVLACWVGCTLLVSILKTDLKESEEAKNLKNYQKFFGRFMIFGIVAALQGLIIGIGDIILKIQVVNYPLFLLTAMLTSVVFMLFVYSLTISFGNVGKAISIVVMVLQVAGSGGTFPIELLPRFFQVIQPFMPFYPAMSAFRETIGGFYGNTYIMSILGLLSHTIIPLLLGLVFRRNIIHLKQKVNEELEKTEIIL